MPRKTHYSQLLDLGNRFDDKIEDINWLKGKIALTNNTDDINLLDIMENELLDHLLDLCTPGEIEDARTAFEELSKPKPKPERKPRQKAPKKPTPVRVFKQKRDSQASRIAARLDKQDLEVKIKVQSPDLSKLIPVVIDKSTTIYLKPGQDIDAEVKAYHARQKNRFNQYKEEKR